MLMKLFGRDVCFSRTRTVAPEEMVCFGCGRDGHSARKLIAGPAPMFICDDCVTAAELALTTDDTASESRGSLVRTEGHRCSFCNKAVPMATAGAGAGICQRCIQICRDILTEDLRLEIQRPRE